MLRVINEFLSSGEFKVFDWRQGTTQKRNFFFEKKGNYETFDTLSELCYLLKTHVCYD